MEFCTRYLIITAVSVGLSIILLVLAGVDRGVSSYYLMLIIPSLTLIHHAFVLFFPAYPHDGDPQQADAEAANFPKLPVHAKKLHLGLLFVLSISWTLATAITTYVLVTIHLFGMKNLKTPTSPWHSTDIYLAGAQCTIGLVECILSWVIFVICCGERSRMIAASFTVDHHHHHHHHVLPAKSLPRTAPCLLRL